MAIGVYGLVAVTARADIYSWTDENGVTHFTNYAPPKQAKLIMKTPEIPYDEEADNQRRETDRLEIARQELAERETFLLQEQQAAERRIAEANARADAALREADRVMQEAEAAAEDSNYDRSNAYNYGYGYYPYYPYSRFDRFSQDYLYTRYPGYYHKNYYRWDRYQKKHPYKFQRGRPNKNHFQKSIKQNFNRPHTSFRSQGLSHQERTALFRGRHGRF
jgi:hypothetical protein